MYTLFSIFVCLYYMRNYKILRHPNISYMSCSVLGMIIAINLDSTFY